MAWICGPRSSCWRETGAGRCASLLAAITRLRTFTFRSPGQMRRRNADADLLDSCSAGTGELLPLPDRLYHHRGGALPDGLHICHHTGQAAEADADVHPNNRVDYAIFLAAVVADYTDDHDAAVCAGEVFRHVRDPDDGSGE